MTLDQTTQLLASALGGDDDARGALLERLRPRIVLWVTARMSPALKAKVDPEDVAQDVLLAVHRGLDGFEVRGHAAFLGWLFRVAENRIRDQIDHWSAQKRKPPEPMTFTQTSPVTAADRKERVGVVRRALDELPEDYREVIRLRRFQELESSEVARIMDRSENAVRVLYCRALKALGRHIKKEETGV